MNVNTILTWPLIAINQRQLLYGGAAVATAYYIGGGWPNQGQSWMTLAQGYLGGSVVFSVLYHGSPGSAPPTMTPTWTTVRDQESAMWATERETPGLKDFSGSLY